MNIRRACTALFALLILASSALDARGINTQDLFGFLHGTDVGELGDRELESETAVAAGKRTGSYLALFQTTEFEFVPIERLRVEIGGTFADHRIADVAEFYDVHRTTFQAISVDLRYQLLSRATSPFGLTIQAVPYWARIDDVSGQPVEINGAEFALLLDKEIVPDQIVAAFNLLYAPDIARLQTGDTLQESALGLGSAVMAQIQPGLLLGAEARYLRVHESLGLDNLVGHALFAGPNMYLAPAKNWHLTLTWSFQLIGQAVDQPGSLDLLNFPRQMMLLKIGYGFPP